jgi:hypothetical protein
MQLEKEVYWNLRNEHGGKREGRKGQMKKQMQLEEGIKTTQIMM